MSQVIGVNVATLWTGPDAPREIEAPVLADEPDPGAWTRALDLAARKGLGGRILTQGLLGETVEVINEADGWADVVLTQQPSTTDPRGYRGFLRSAHLADAPQPTGAEAVVVVPFAETADLVLSFGTRLPVLETGTDGVRLALPGAGEVVVDPATVRAPDEVSTGAGPLLDLARQFLGLDYLWGGTSAWGMDCSGFVHLSHRVLGAVVPRDASDQVEAAHQVDLAERGEGDLLFFARPGKKVHHVGFATRDAAGAPTMMHAPESGDSVKVEDAPLNQQRLETLVAAGTFL
ncbi:MAG: C40 family peptidase [Propionibacteriaceae bacterium]